MASVAGESSRNEHIEPETGKLEAAYDHFLLAKSQGKIRGSNESQQNITRRFEKKHFRGSTAYLVFKKLSTADCLSEMVFQTDENVPP